MSRGFDKDSGQQVTIVFYDNHYLITPASVNENIRDWTTFLCHSLLVWLFWKYLTPLLVVGFFKDIFTLSSMFNNVLFTFQRYIFNTKNN